MLALNRAKLNTRTQKKSILVTVFFLFTGLSSHEALAFKLVDDIDQFGSMYAYSWYGKGKINSTPRINCEAVYMTINSISAVPQVLSVKDIEIHCGDNSYKLDDRVIEIDTKSRTTHEDGVVVGQAPKYVSDRERWFTFKIDMPELGPGPLYAALLAYPPGRFVNEPGPVLFFDIAKNPNGTGIVFSSLLKPDENSVQGK